MCRFLDKKGWKISSFDRYEGLLGASVAYYRLKYIGAIYHDVVCFAMYILFLLEGIGINLRPASVKILFWGIWYNWSMSSTTFMLWLSGLLKCTHQWYTKFMKLQKQQSCWNHQQLCHIGMQIDYSWFGD